jgi:hypothetical protein
MGVHRRADDRREESGRADAVVVEYTDDDGTVYQTLYNTEILLASGRCRGRR